MDAGAFGARLTPRDAYRFARGEEVTASSGQPAKLSRPLDFLVVADHSDGMGFFPLLLAGGPTIQADSQGRKWNELIQSGKGRRPRLDIIVSFGKARSRRPTSQPGTTAYRDAWRETIAAAEAYNAPGSVHDVHRVEWTSILGQQSSSQRHLPRQR
jgi:hypothetical protein